MTEPITETLTDPIVATAVTAVKAVVDNAQSLGLTWGLRPAVVVADSSLTSNSVRVTLDGDTAVLDVVSLVGPLLKDQRVTTMSVPPGGIFIIGSTYMDPWHAIGDNNEPPFENSWGNLGAGGYGNVGFRRTLDGHLELTGIASFTGTTAASTLVFVLPTGYRPDRAINLIASNNPATTGTPVARGITINTLGEVVVTHFAGTINPGPISFEGIYLPLRTGI